MMMYSMPKNSIGVGGLRFPNYLKIGCADNVEMAFVIEYGFCVLFVL